VHGLLLKLASLDSSAERGLRVIEFFDQLVTHHADIDAVARATAVLSGTVVGAVLDDVGEVVVMSPSGDVLASTGPSAHAVVRDIVVDDSVVGRAWLERSMADAQLEWDDLIVERMAQCLSTLSARHASSRRNSELGFADPAVLHVLIREDASETETARAARLVGFRVGETVRVLAVHADSGIDESLTRVRTHITATLRTRSVAAPLTRTLAVVIVATTEMHPVALSGLAVCVGPPVRVENCHSSWAMARRGVRFASLGGRWPTSTTTDELGCVAALADLDAATVAGLGDVQAIARVAAGKGGLADLQLLECMGALTSLRDIADALHMHHSSVAYRLGNLSDALGYDVRTQEGRYRARTALTLWQLHVTAS
jgi:PucR C-terminal helix-turn-helix domain